MPRRRRVAGAMPGEHIESDGGVFHRARQRTGVVDRVRAREHAFGTDTSVRRLQTDEVTHRRRVSNRAAVVRSDRKRREPRSDLGRGAATRSARRVIEVPRIVHVPEVRVRSRLASGEFVQVGLAHQHRTGLVEASCDLGVHRRRVFFQKACPRGGRDTGGLENILETDRDTVERVVHVPLRALTIPAARLVERALRKKRDVAVELGLERFGSFDRGADELCRGYLASLEKRRELVER